MLVDGDEAALAQSEQQYRKLKRQLTERHLQLLDFFKNLQPVPDGDTTERLSRLERKVNASHYRSELEVRRKSCTVGVGDGTRFPPRSHPDGISNWREVPEDQEVEVLRAQLTKAEARIAALQQDVRDGQHRTERLHVEKDSLTLHIKQGLVHMLKTKAALRQHDAESQTREMQSAIDTLHAGLRCGEGSDWEGKRPADTIDVQRLVTELATVCAERDRYVEQNADMLRHLEAASDGSRQQEMEKIQDHNDRLTRQVEVLQAECQRTRAERDALQNEGDRCRKACHHKRSLGEALLRVAESTRRIEQLQTQKAVLQGELQRLVAERGGLRYGRPRSSSLMSPTDQQRPQSFMRPRAGSCSSLEVMTRRGRRCSTTSDYGDGQREVIHSLKQMQEQLARQEKFVQQEVYRAVGASDEKLRLQQQLTELQDSHHSMLAKYEMLQDKLGHGASQTSSRPTTPCDTTPETSSSRGTASAGETPTVDDSDRIGSADTQDTEPDAGRSLLGMFETLSAPLDASDDTASAFTPIRTGRELESPTSPPQTSKAQIEGYNLTLNTPNPWMASVSPKSSAPAEGTVSSASVPNSGLDVPESSTSVGGEPLGQWSGWSGDEGDELVRETVSTQTMPAGVSAAQGDLWPKSARELGSTVRRHGGRVRSHSTVPFLSSPPPSPRPRSSDITLRSSTVADSPRSMTPTKRAVLTDFPGSSLLRSIGDGASRFASAPKAPPSARPTSPIPENRRRRATVVGTTSPLAPKAPRDAKKQPRTRKVHKSNPTNRVKRPATSML